MVETFIRENPLLAGAAGVIVAVIAVLFLSAVVSAIRSRRKAAAVREEPVFGRVRSDAARLEASLPDRGRRAEAPPALAAPRRRFGWGVLVLAFIVGFGGGGAGYFFSSTGKVESLLRAIAAVTGTGTSDARESGGMGIAAGGGGEAAPAPGDAAGPDDVQTRLAAFAGKLKEKLPREAGPEIALTTVDTRGLTISLGYSVGRALDETEVPEFDGYIMRTIKSLFCGKDAKELRFLNDNGVSFYMSYDDLGGDVVARLTIPPNFCA